MAHRSPRGIDRRSDSAAARGAAARRLRRLSTTAAVWIAFGLGLGVLAVQGVIFARVERLGWAGTLLVVAANLSLGAVLVGLKVLVAH